MAIISPHQFERAPTEKDVEHIQKRVEQVREKPELKGAGERELIKHAVRTTVTPLPSEPQHESTSVLPNYLQGTSAETKLEVEHLIEVAFRDGIAKANALAEKSNPLILDAFHDVLAGKLYEEFQKRGIFPKEGS